MPMMKNTLTTMLLAGAAPLLLLAAALGAQELPPAPDSEAAAPAAARTLVRVAAAGALAPASPAPAAPAAARAPDAAAAAALATADSLVGARYRFGGQSPTRGFDCSGFVRYVYAAHGVGLPRTAREMAGAGVPVARDTSALRAGDLLLFRLKQRGAVDHVAIYAGNGRIVHAASRRRRFVRYDDLASARGHYYLARLAGVRRVLEEPPPPFSATAAGVAHYTAWNGGVPKP